MHCWGLQTDGIIVDGAKQTEVVSGASWRTKEQSLRVVGSLLSVSARRQLVRGCGRYVERARAAVVRHADLDDSAAAMSELAIAAHVLTEAAGIIHLRNAENVFGALRSAVASHVEAGSAPGDAEIGQMRSALDCGWSVMAASCP